VTNYPVFVFEGLNYIVLHNVFILSSYTVLPVFHPYGIISELN
jgi:hypothetical protein